MKVALGLSGGVDSAVSLQLLQKQGHDVHAVFLECWRAPGCRAEEDRKDALGVALKSGVTFTVLDFKQAYREKVVEYFFKEYAAGRTPNPDVMCNKEIKFGLFYDWAMKEGFDAVATGHYAQIQGVDCEASDVHALQKHWALKMSADSHKDQTYFLYRLRQDQLPHVLFPIGHLRKEEVRKLATTFDIPVAQKPDSQGICFIGEINVHNFIKERLGENPGNVVDTKGRVIGSHKGLWFYTIGQRHGFDSAFTIPKDESIDKHAIPPFYVIRKDKDRNELVVGFGAETYQDTFFLQDVNWITDTNSGNDMFVRLRHTGKLIPCTLSIENGEVHVILHEAVQGIAQGQSAVFYKNGICLGGGIIQ